MINAKKIANRGGVTYWISATVLSGLWAYVTVEVLRGPSHSWGQIAETLFLLLFVFGAPATAVVIAAVVSLFWQLKPTRLIQVLTHASAIFYYLAFWAVSTSESL